MPSDSTGLQIGAGLLTNRTVPPEFSKRPRAPFEGVAPIGLNETKTATHTNLLRPGSAGLVCLDGPRHARQQAALEKYYDRFLSAELGRCTNCHLPGLIKNPESLDDFPHNLFGTRLRAVGRELTAVGKKKDIPARLKLVAREDTDGDGVNNEMELLLGYNPGNAKDTPTKKELGAVKAKPPEFAKFLASYR